MWESRRNTFGLDLLMRWSCREFESPASATGNFRAIAARGGLEPRKGNTDVFATLPQQAQDMDTHLADSPVGALQRPGESWDNRWSKLQYRAAGVIFVEIRSAGSWQRSPHRCWHSPPHPEVTAVGAEPRIFPRQLLQDVRQGWN